MDWTAMRKETSFKSKIFWIKILLGYLLFSNHHGHCFWVDLLDFLLELCVIFSFDFFIHLSLAYDVVAKSPVRMMRVIEKIVVLLSSIHHRFAVSMLCIFHRSIMRRTWQAAFSRGYETSTTLLFKGFQHYWLGHFPYFLNYIVRSS